jgi:hypothetical protein
MNKERTLLFVIVFTCLLNQFAWAETSDKEIFERHTNVVNAINVVATLLNIANASSIMILSLETKNLMRTYNYNGFDPQNPAHDRLQNNWGRLTGVLLVTITTICIQLMINLVHKFVIKDWYNSEGNYYLGDKS